MQPLKMFPPVLPHDLHLIDKARLPGLSPTKLPGRRLRLPLLHPSADRPALQRELHADPEPRQPISPGPDDGGYRAREPRGPHLAVGGDVVADAHVRVQPDAAAGGAFARERVVGVHEAALAALEVQVGEGVVDAAEAERRVGVEGRRVEDHDAVPAREHLDRLAALRGGAGARGGEPRPVVRGGLLARVVAEREGVVIVWVVLKVHAARRGVVAVARV